jgi:hypothetical protein
MGPIAVLLIEIIAAGADEQITKLEEASSSP